METQLIKGKPVKVIIAFALPLIIANLFQMLYTTVDTIIVGQYVGTLALASVGVTSPVVDLLLGLAIGLANGLSIVIAQKIGSKQRTEVKKAMINGLYIMIVLGLSITCIGLMIQSTLFQWMNVSKELLSGALNYAGIIFIGALFTALYNYESALLRAYGDSVTPLLFLILSAILNIVFDLVFVLIFHLGISGVALATVIAQLICCLLCYFYMKKRLHLFSFDKEDFKIDFICIKENLKVGLPMAFFQSLLAISFLIVQSALNSLGSQEVAAYTAAYKMDSLMMQMLAGFGTAMSTYTAQNYGQRAFKRIKDGSKSMLVITITLSIVVTIMAHLFNKQFMMLFVSKKEIEVIHLGMKYISFTSWFYFVLGINFIVRFVLTGSGEASIPLLVGILEVIVRCLGTYFLVYPLGFTGMTYINPLCWITSTFLIYCLYPYLLHKAFNGK